VDSMCMIGKVSGVGQRSLNPVQFKREETQGCFSGY
jgi:hypothetical protein